MASDPLDVAAIRAQLKPSMMAPGQYEIVTALLARVEELEKIVADARRHLHVTVPASTLAYSTMYRILNRATAEVPHD